MGIYGKLQTRAVYYSLSTIVVTTVIYLLFNENIKQRQETNPIKVVSVKELPITLIKPPEINDEIREKIKQQEVFKNNNTQNNQLQNNAMRMPANDNHKPAHNIKIDDDNLAARNDNVTPTMPQIMNLPPANGNNGGNNQANNSGNNLPMLGKGSQKTIYDIECENIDENERPKNCPKNGNAKKMLKAEHKLKGENITGFTSSEMNSRKYSGWREQCENESGGKYQVCVPMGKKPARVKTPYELCMEKGLGGCTRPKRPDGSDDEALNYGN